MRERSISSVVVSVIAATALLATGALAIPGCSDSDPPQNNNNNQNSTSDRCPPGYLLVPGGTFTLGVDADDLVGVSGVEWSPDMGPAHKVTLTSDFCMSKNEVTVAQYRACRTSNGCTGEGPWTMPGPVGCNYSDTDPSRDDHPVNCVTYEAAREYCQAQGGDLPTEAQWIRAAQGEDRRHFAWGNSEPDCSHANYDVNGPPDETPNGLGCAEATSPPYTWPVGTAPANASPYGLLDMTGNVAEYVLGCGAWFQPCDGDLGCVDPLPADCRADPSHLALGGCLSNDKWGLYAFFRGTSTTTQNSSVGLRCAQAPKSR
jgi:formylglycine-generating enzyme required for sulfatase activity